MLDRWYTTLERRKKSVREQTTHSSFKCIAFFHFRESMLLQIKQLCFGKLREEPVRSSGQSRCLRVYMGQPALSLPGWWHAVTQQVNKDSITPPPNTHTEILSKNTRNYTAIYCIYVRKLDLGKHEAEISAITGKYSDYTCIIIHVLCYAALYLSYSMFSCRLHFLIRKANIYFLQINIKKSLQPTFECVIIDSFQWLYHTNMLPMKGI